MSCVVWLVFSSMVVLFGSLLFRSCAGVTLSIWVTLWILRPSCRCSGGFVACWISCLCLVC